MKKPVLLTAIAVLCLISADVKAASLFGKVIDVSNGDVITVFNLNRPVRIKLLGVDAPELDQAFGDVARKHLADLIYDKSVMVEYSGIGADSSLSGRVLLNGADVGAQMIRDGAAWFDPNNQSRLSAADRDVYQQSEQAARSERRGLWEAETPMAPWEFVAAKTRLLSEGTSLSKDRPAARARHNRPVPELTNLSLMTTGRSAARPGSTSSGSANNSWATSGSRKNWRQFRPAGEAFSVLVPEDGRETTSSVPFGDRMVDVNTYEAREGLAMYSVTWLTGPTYGETDEAALDGSLKSYLDGVAQGYEISTGLKDFKCVPQAQKNISLNGYTGIEFDLRSCTFPSRVRMYTKISDNQRRLYMGVVLYAEDDENVLRFLKSFTVDSAAPPAKSALR